MPMVSPGLEDQARTQGNDVVGIDVCEDVLEDDPELGFGFRASERILLNKRNMRCHDKSRPCEVTSRSQPASRGRVVFLMDRVVGYQNEDWKTKTSPKPKA